MDKVNKTDKKNRRAFFRIYDDVNLFYQKIDKKQLAELRPHPDSSYSPNFDSGATQSTLPKLDKNLFEDHFKDNGTCNVNISASGMAFSTDHTLHEGDILVIKVQLASGPAVIQTYANVVYCKDNHPYDTEYPYFIGTHFIDMEDDYRGLLAAHIEKKHKQDLRVRAVVLTALIIVLLVPTLVFSLLFELIHLIIEVILHIAHLAFEFVELNLDHVIEHFFETDLHQTQVIVFYIIATSILFILYRIARRIPDFARFCKKSQLAFWSRKKSNLLFFWSEQSLFNKIKLVVIGILFFVVYVFLGI